MNFQHHRTDLGILVFSILDKVINVDLGIASDVNVLLAIHAPADIGYILIGQETGGSTGHDEGMRLHPQHTLWSSSTREWDVVMCPSKCSLIMR